MKKNILFVSALSQELNIVKKNIKGIKIKRNDMSFLFFSTWVWNYKTILNLSEFIYNKNIDFIVNIWVCWYKESKNDLIQIARIKNIADDKELIVPIFFKFANLNSIACSEKIVFDKNILKEENYVDMESYWIEILCTKYSIARLILKIPVDKIWYETKKFDFKIWLSKLEDNIDYNDLIIKIFNYLDKQNIDVKLNHYFEYYNMTFTEKIIFKNLYNKYEACTNLEFSVFFEKNKDFTKKQLFNYLENI